MASGLSKLYGDHIEVDRTNHVVRVVNHDGSTKGLKLGSTLVTSTGAELNILDGVTATAAELNYNDITTLGTGAASKAVVLDAGEDYTWPATGVLTVGVVKDPAATTLGATFAEINTASDLSAQTETIAAAGAVSVLKRITKVALVGAGAITLAAPDATMLGYVKILEMTADNGDVTMALTNVDGGSAATTCTFNDVGDALILVAGVSKWHVIKEVGVVMV